MEQDQLIMEQVQASTSRHLPAAVTDIGCEREINEDRYAGYKVNGGYVWIVCDGMGGAVGGELAAQLALDTIKRTLESQEVDMTVEILAQAIQEANRVIILRRQNPVFSGMGTTIVAALVNEYGVFVVHAGDSRAYVVSSSRIEQLTTDHTYVQDLVDKGMITQDEALHHPQSHVLTRCLGGEPRVRVDKNCFGLHAEPSRESEFLLLCSDGLYSLVTDEEIHEVIRTSSPQQACMSLVEMARDRGGYDNITLTVVPLSGVLHGEPVMNKAPSVSMKSNRVSSNTLRATPTKTLTKAQLVVIVSMLAIVSLLATVIAFVTIF
jgi:serine/threonine protein phosphatase PrpC